VFKTIFFIENDCKGNTFWPKRFLNLGLYWVEAPCCGRRLEASVSRQADWKFVPGHYWRWNFGWGGGGEIAGV